MIPAEYVSMFKGNTDLLKEERDSEIDTYRAVLTGMNQLLMEMADYIKEKRNTQVCPPRKVVSRLM